MDFLFKRAAVEERLGDVHVLYVNLAGREFTAGLSQYMSRRFYNYRNAKRRSSMNAKLILAGWFSCLGYISAGISAVEAAQAPGYITINVETQAYAEPNTKSAVQSTLPVGQEISIDNNAPRIKGWMRADYDTVVQASIFSPGTKVQESGWFRNRDVVRADQIPRLLPARNKAWKPTYLCMMMTMPDKVLFTQEYQFESDGGIRSWVKAVAPDGRSRKMTLQGQAYLAGNLLKLVYADIATNETKQTHFGYKPMEGKIYDLSPPFDQKLYKVSVFQVTNKQRVNDSPEAKTRCTHRPE